MPLIHATRAPTQETALLAGTPLGSTFNVVFHGKVPEAVVVRRDLPYSLTEVSSLRYCSQDVPECLYRNFLEGGPAELLKCDAYICKDMFTDVVVSGGVPHETGAGVACFAQVLEGNQDLQD